MTTTPTDRPPRVLIVDDDRDFATSLVKFLMDEGFEVHAEYNGTAALKLFQNRGFEVAFIDALLPGMDGFSLCKEIRWIKHGERMPIVMLSGVYRASSHAREATEKYRLTDYLEKPVKPSVIVATLRKIFGRDYPAPLPSEQPETSQAMRQIINTFFLYKQEMIPLVGDLSETPFPILLNQMYVRKLSGQLLVVNGQAKKLLHFAKGRPVAISSNILNECLGRVLLKEGEINEETYQATLQTMRQTGRKHGECLLQSGAISSLQLTQALRTQYEQKLYAIFGWKSAEYSFKPKDDIPPAPVDIDTHPYTLIRTALLGHTPPEQVTAWLKPYLSAPLEAGPDYQEKMSKGGFNLKETRFVGGLKTDETLEDALSNPLKPRTAMPGFLFSLICIDALRVGIPLRVEEDAPIEIDERSVNSSGAWSVLHSHVQMRLSKNPGESSTQIPAQNDDPTMTNKVRIEKIEMMQAMQTMTPEQRAQYTRLFEMRGQLREKTYFEFFDVTPDTPAPDIKAKFLKMARTYHPDAVPFRDVPAIHKLADEVFTLLSTASDTLTTPAKRKEYMETLEGGGNRDATAEVANLLAAEQFFFAAQAAGRRKDWSGAKKQLQEALKLNPNEGEYYAELGWAHFNLSPHDLVSRQEAEKYLGRAIEMAPKLASPHLYLGAIRKIMGDIPGAAQHFSNALSADPKNARAKSEIRLLKMRLKEERSQKSKKSLFGGLFGKK